MEAEQNAPKDHVNSMVEQGLSAEVLVCRQARGETRRLRRLALGNRLEPGDERTKVGGRQGDVRQQAGVELLERRPLRDLERLLEFCERDQTQEEGLSVPDRGKGPARRRAGSCLETGSSDDDPARGRSTYPTKIERTSRCGTRHHPRARRASLLGKGSALVRNERSVDRAGSGSTAAAGTRRAERMWPARETWTSTDERAIESFRLSGKDESQACLGLGERERA